MRIVPTRADDTGRVPDLLVTCDERDQRDDADAVDARTMRYSKFVAEILSASNDIDDLVHKRNEYQALPAIFVETEYRDGDEIRLAAIDTIVNLDNLYRAGRIATRRQRLPPA